MAIDDPVSERIIGCAFKVHGALGHGFLEKVYENALAHELRKAGLCVQQQADIQVFYDGVKVGTYFADLLVEGRILVELKSVKAIDDAHMAQCLNYLKATGLQTCLLLRFGKTKVEVRRLGMNRENKPGMALAEITDEARTANDSSFSLSP